MRKPQIKANMVLGMKATQYY